MRKREVIYARALRLSRLANRKTASNVIFKAQGTGCKEPSELSSQQFQQRAVNRPNNVLSRMGDPYGLSLLDEEGSPIGMSINTREAFRQASHRVYASGKTP